jgi:hypothetical protein
VRVGRVRLVVGRGDGRLPIHHQNFAGLVPDEFVPQVEGLVRRGVDTPDRDLFGAFGHLGQAIPRISGAPFGGPFVGRHARNRRHQLAAPFPLSCRFVEVALLQDRL